MKTFKIFLLVAIMIPAGLKAQNKKYLKEYLSVIASDSLEGRKPGKPGGEKAAAYIVNILKQNGIQPLGGASYYQPFDVVTDIELAKSNYLNFDGQKDFAVGKDYTPLSFSANGTFEGSVVFVWYGFDFEDKGKSVNDYNGVDAKGKWVIMLTDEPELGDGEKDIYAPYAQLRMKALTAKDHGAVGVIFVKGKLSDENDDLIPLLYDKSSADAGIGVINMTRKAVNRILKSTGKSIEELEKIYNQTKNEAHQALNINKKMLVSIGVMQKKTKTENIIAVLPGEDKKLKDEWIVIGAHYDHLGYGGEGSGSRMPDTMAVHNGADDNGSGTVALLEIAKAMKNRPHKRSIMFIWFGAEEMGLLGSKYFTEHPLIKLDHIVGMINMDMMGRLRDNKFYAGGVGTSKGAKDLLQKVNQKYKFDLILSESGYGPSDHASFYMKNIPVLYFNTGIHDDYHTPFDDVEKINFKGLEKTARFVTDVLLEWANTDNKPVFQEAGDKFAGSKRYRYKVTLGIIPDFAGQEKRGLRVDGVRKGGPAEKGGMKKGDIIVAVNGKPVKNIYDYMGRLTQLHKGQVITVDVLRNGKKKVLLINL